MSKLLSMMRNKGIPSIYKVVDWIQSTGTQWINTDIGKDLTHNYRFVGKFNWQDVTNRQVFGAQGGTYFGVVNGYYQVTQASTGNTGKVAPINTDIDFDVTFYLPTQKVSYIFNDISKFNENSDFTYTNVGKFYLFNLGNNLTFPSKCKLYYCKLFDNDTLVRNFIPVYDTITQKYGMWESVQRKFYGNDGTGDFGGSIVGYTVVGSPTITDGVVSGFSDGNYITTSSNFQDTDIDKDLEILLKFKTGELNNCCIFRFGNSSSSVITAYNGTRLAFTVNNNLYSPYSSYVLSANTLYWLRITRQNRVYYFDISTDGTNWINMWISSTTTELINSGSSTPINFGFKTASFPAPSNYEYYMKDSYIKYNNKLWFIGIER
jgi:regulation of enolase protein 1 (concanavalin A-like superfamily)